MYSESEGPTGQQPNLVDLIEERVRLRSENEKLRQTVANLVDEKADLFNSKAALEHKTLDLEGRLESLMKENETLRQENERLLKTIAELKSDNEKMDKRIRVLETEKTQREALLVFADLARLYIIYCIEPNIKSLWRDFTNELAEWQAEVTLGNRTQVDFSLWLEQKQKESSQSIPLLDLWELIRERNKGSHSDIRGTAQQQLFLREAENKQWPDNLNGLASSLVAGLKSVNLRRLK